MTTAPDLPSNDLVHSCHPCPESLAYHLYRFCRLDPGCRSQRTPLLSPAGRALLSMASAAGTIQLAHVYLHMRSLGVNTGSCTETCTVFPQACLFHHPRRTFSNPSQTP